MRIVLEGLGAEKEEESVTHVLSWGKERTLWEMEVVKVFSASQPGMPGAETRFRAIRFRTELRRALASYISSYPGPGKQRQKLELDPESEQVRAGNWGSYLRDQDHAGYLRGAGRTHPLIWRSLGCVWLTVCGSRDCLRSCRRSPGKGHVSPYHDG